MSSIVVTCIQCGKEYSKDLRHYNENIKLKNNFYCSRACESKYKTKSRPHVCDNPLCKRVFMLRPAASSKHNYCSQHCAAVVNNSKRQKKIHHCNNPSCSNSFMGRRLYCSAICIPKQIAKYKREDILQVITAFVEKHERTPLKSELIKFNKPARMYFGTWNNAIITAGFKPNPVMFAKKYLAKDGHKCDSLAEKIIDDWLFSKNIKHKRSVEYPRGKGLNCDFVIGKYWIEFFGLSGQLKRYDQLKKKKLELVAKHNLNLIQLYPEDLFPKPLIHLKLSPII